MESNESLRQRLSQRLSILYEDFRAAQNRLKVLDEKAADAKATLLRLSGAIQVLEEELGLGPKTPSAAARHSEPPSSDHDREVSSNV